MSTPIPGWPRQPPPDDQDPINNQNPAVEQAPDLTANSPVSTAEPDIVVVAVRVQVPVPVKGPVPGEGPVPVPVPVEAGQPWTGTIIEAVPTTADEIAALVLAVPDVTRLHAGRFGEVATYLPGRRVTGVKLGDELIEVHVVVAGQVPVRQTAQVIHERVATVVATPVHVFIEDVAVA